MSNVIIIGDCHLKANSPVSRKDDYPLAILHKLEYLSEVAQSYNSNTFILLGDVFDSPTTSLPYLASVISTFKKISEKGIKVYTIVGNHDIKNNRMESLHSTALGILISTGLVSLAPSELLIDNTLFRCFNYPEEIIKKKTYTYEVCIAHRYYNFGLDEYTLRDEDIEKLSYDAMILGHYHVPCDTKNILGTTLYIPGSLSRSTSEPYNRLRIPRALVFNCSNHKAAYIEVSCSPASDVFIEKVEANGCEILSMKDLIQFIKTSYTSSNMDVREYFNTIEIPYECRERISKYLDSIGA